MSRQQPRRGVGVANTRAATHLCGCAGCCVASTAFQKVGGQASQKSGPRPPQKCVPGHECTRAYVQCTAERVYMFAGARPDSPAAAPRACHNSVRHGCVHTPVAVGRHRRGTSRAHAHVRATRALHEHWIAARGAPHRCCDSGVACSVDPLPWQAPLLLPQFASGLSFRVGTVRRL